MYDLLAGSANMESSYLLGKGKAMEAFPMLKSDGLRGAVVYYDGALPPSCLPLSVFDADAPSPSPSQASTTTLA